MADPTGNGTIAPPKRNPVAGVPVITLPQLIPNASTVPTANTVPSGYRFNNFRSPVGGTDSSTTRIGTGTAPTGNSPVSGLGVGGSIGARINPVGAPTAPNSLRVDYSKKRLDTRFGAGWVDDFMAHHGTDPITFFSKNFPQLENDPAAMVNATLGYAEKYGDFIPGAIQEWQKVHGNVAPPPEQWQAWDRMIDQGGQPQYGGAGINPYQVY